MESEKKTTQVEITQIFTERESVFDYYSCEEAVTRLNEYLDRELGENERADVVKHLQICAPCLERFHFEETLITSIKVKMCSIVAPQKLKQKLCNAIRANKTI